MRDEGVSVAQCRDIHEGRNQQAASDQDSNWNRSCRGPKRDCENNPDDPDPGRITEFLPRALQCFVERHGDSPALRNKVAGL